jgi:hypothetical protein
MDLSGDLKTILDVGLGAFSLMLWLRQGKTNKQQLEINAAQNRATQDLTTMVKDHDARIGHLEKRAPARKRRAK